MDNIKYLHIMSNEKFINGFIQFIDSNFDSKEHKFLILGGVDEREMPIINNDNVIVVQNFSKCKILKVVQYMKTLIKYMKKSNNVYLHSLFNKNIILFFYIFRCYLRKINWIIWGGDLYCYENRDYSKLKNKIWYKIEEYVKGNVGCVNTLVPGDYDIAKKYYKVKGKYKEARYTSDEDFNFINSLPIVSKDEVWIQVGNSADASNNHFEILDDLKKFRNENIKIYCILSYGDKDYANKVVKYGKNIFGNKFVGIFDFMNRKEYWKYISTMDILVLNHKRQQGLGNIFMYGYLEKKIYLRDDISSWNYLVNELELKLNPYENIKKENYKEFIENTSKGNKEKCFNTFFSNKVTKDIWMKNFNNEILEI